MEGLWIIVTAILVSIPCGILGCFLILRKVSMISDAISHAALPGIVVGFMLSGSLSKAPMLIGASMFGLFTAFIIEWLNKKLKLQMDAAIGLTFTFLFAVGVILISLYAGNVHLDGDSVLYGEIAFVEFNTIANIPQSIYFLSTLNAIVFLVLFISYKAFNITSFDPEYANSLGIRSSIWHYVLMALVSLSAVVCFEYVGAILYVAFIVGPAATAYLLTNKLKTMLFLSMIVGIIASVIGFYLAVMLNASITGAISVALGFLFILALLFSPSEGVLFKGKRNQDLSSEM